MLINKTAVVGAGIMGRGISLVYALNGFKVFLYDTSQDVLLKAKALIGDDLNLLVDEGLISAAANQMAQESILVTGSLETAVGEAEFITEAVPEQLALKWQVLARIESLAPEAAIIASNTSTLPLSELTRHLVRPERMLITHFFNPAHLVPLVEIVRAAGTPPQIVSTTLGLMRQIGKVPVVLKKEVPGFIANRLQAAVFREALHLVASGVADMRDVDTVMTSGPGFRWSIIGPMETADFGGLDTWQSVMNNLAPELDDTRTAPEVIKDLNRRGHLGVKTGQGFYAYPSGEVVAEKIRNRDLAFIQLLKLRHKV
ncbi:MAG: 3-hydroxyacyl-CoA dehydrogenase family protein [Desulfuromonadales bacterium]